MRPNRTADGYVWRSRQTHPERFGQKVTVTFISGTDHVVVEFADGQRLQAFKWQVRKASS